MKFPMFIILAATSIFATASLCESAIIQGGALTILGWAVWYVLARALPGERKAFVEALKEERKDFTASLFHIKHALDRLTAAVTGDPDE